MITGTSDCYSQSLPLHGGVQAQVVPETNSSSSLLFNLSILKNKVHQIQCHAGVLLSSENGESTIGLPTMTNLIQEVIVAASSMMFSCQQMANGDGGRVPSVDVVDQWFEDSDRRIDKKKKIDDSSDSYDIIELDAPDLLAKYTHYCQICGKGFKRDANLRMHMRAHGDEYKSIAALSNPNKINNNNNNNIVEYPLPRKYSCPHQGCRWNRNHARFQPLKSMICVKNHYKRSHCPKMYICKRCNNKQFSVLSDLRTHEKRCGDLKWQCSCGTTFSRKDKLMGHLALFVGHAPAVVPGTRVLNSPGFGES